MGTDVPKVFLAMKYSVEQRSNLIITNYIRKYLNTQRIMSSVNSSANLQKNKRWLVQVYPFPPTKG